MVKRGMPYGAWVQVRLRGWLREIAIAAGLLAITIVLQWRVGAYRAELDGYPDESGHYVTGLLLSLIHISSSCTTESSRRRIH